MASTPLLIGSVLWKTARIENSNGTNLIDLFDPGGTPARISVIFCITDDTVAKNVTLYQYQSGVASPIDWVRVVPATVSVAMMKTNILSPTRWDWLNPKDLSIAVPANHKLQVGVDVAMSSGKTLWVHTSGGFF